MQITQGRADYIKNLLLSKTTEIENKKKCQKIYSN